VLAVVGEADIEAAVAILLHARRYRDATWLGDTLEAGRDVDAVAQDIVTVDHDVADMDADAKLKPALLRHLRVAGHHPALDVHGAAHRIDDAREFRQQAVARGLHDASAMCSHLGLEKLDAVRAELPDRAFLVEADELAITRHVGRQDRR